MCRYVVFQVQLKNWKRKTIMILYKIWPQTALLTRLFYELLPHFEIKLRVI